MRHWLALSMRLSHLLFMQLLHCSTISNNFLSSIHLFFSFMISHAFRKYPSEARERASYNKKEEGCFFSFSGQGLDTLSAAGGLPPSFSFFWCLFLSFSSLIFHSLSFQHNGMRCLEGVFFCLYVLCVLCDLRHCRSQRRLLLPPIGHLGGR